MGGRKDITLFPAGKLTGTSFEASKWLSLDVCGLFGVSCSWAVHLFSFFALASHIIAGSMFATAIFVLVYTPISLLAMSSLYMAWTTDPGAVPMGARPLVTIRRAASGEMTSPAQNSRRRGIRRCHKCADNFKAPRAHHDSVTGRCIVKFDHFCPWVGNAVGALNHKFFVLFISYTLCSCMVSIFLIVLRAFHCGYVSSVSDSDSEDSAITTDAKGGGDRARILPGVATVLQPECVGWHDSYSVLGLMVVSLVFLVFTCTMLFDQVEAIQTNTSKIARMKMSVGQAGTELSRVTEEFNEMFGGHHKEAAWHWFLPLPVEFPRGMEKVVLGYEWDEAFDAIPYEDGSGHSSRTASRSDSAESLKIEMTETKKTNGPVERDLENDMADTEDKVALTGSPVRRPALVKRSNSKSPTMDIVELT